MNKEETRTGRDKIEKQSGEGRAKGESSGCPRGGTLKDTWIRRREQTTDGRITAR